MEPPLWAEGASPWPHEREALAFVRARLPNHEPYRAWSNVEFIAEDGTVNEVDLLVVTGRGFWLVEIKSFPGVLTGDGQRWRLRWPNGRVGRKDHPLILANTKAKRLRSLLARQGAFRKEKMPWVTALVFLSSPELDCRLQAIGRTAVCGRDPDSPQGPQALSPTGSPLVRPRSAPDQGSTRLPPLPGIVATLKDPSAAGLRGTAINRVQSARIAEALGQAGLQPSNRGRRAGDWEIGELLDEGPGWQDFLATRPGAGARRRARVYLAGVATTADEEARLRRQADREFNVVHDLRHDGIARPLDLVQAERGPTLLFDLDDGEERLDLWAPTNVPDLSPEARIELVRQLGEAVAHAHAQKVSHRAMTPRCILVRPAPEGDDTELPSLVVGHWQAGARELATRLTAHTTSSDTSLGATLAERLEATEQVYLAPEVFSTERPDGVALDVFSLGALAFLVLTGRPPAEDLTEREAMLAAHAGLALDSAVDSPPSNLVTLVMTATDPVPARRAPVWELLELLDGALDELTRPETADGTPAPVPEDTPTTVDAMGAHQGDILEGGWEVLRRLGSGSTAVAFLCRRQGSTSPEVLKVGKDEELAERLRDEARILEELGHPGHPGIVELYGVERVGGRTTLRLAPAGDPDDKLGLTLADRLDAQGRLGLDLLERFGDDLLSVVDYLQSVGVSHRDIKPDNLGVRRRRGDGSLHLVLFDFSLARTPDTSLGAGTTGYLDPFLAERPGRRWDPAAERYAAAATLHEMATGTRPRWGDGRTDPLHLDDEVPQIDVGLLDPSVRDRLAAFFEKALHRRPASRFDTADEMRMAWRMTFTAASRPTTSGDGDAALADAALEQLAAAAAMDTPVAELGLSGRAASTLERLGVTTVSQLLEFSTPDWNRMPGVGKQVGREVLAAIGRLRAHADLDPGDPAASIDRLADQLVPRSGSRAPADGNEALRSLLGLGARVSPALPFPGDRSDQADQADHRPLVELPWPGPANLKARLGLDRTAYDALVERARTRWARQPALTQIRNDLHTLLHQRGSVLPGDELALSLLAQRGSTATGPDRLRKARAVVRAALEVEASRESSRFTWRRLGGGTAAVVAVTADELDGEELADFAATLGVVADGLAAQDPPPSPAAVVDALHQVPAPAGLPPLTDHRLVRLAAASSAIAAVSSRMELYPRGMSAERATTLARTALLGTGALAEEDVRSRVRSRFPAAEALPDRPQLDQLLSEAVGLEWYPGGTTSSGAPRPPGFRVPVPPPVALSTAFSGSSWRDRTGSDVDAPEEARAAADVVQDRLERQAKAGGYLVLTVPPRYQEQAVDALAALGATPLDVDELVVDAMREVAAAKGIQWDQALVATDADGPGGPRWPRLLTVVRDAVAPQRAELLTGHEHVLLVHPGLLARYDLLGLLDELREATRRPDPDQRLRAVWVLVPAEDPDARPTVAGKAVPVTSSAEFLALPKLWLQIAHRGSTTTSPGALS